MLSQMVECGMDPLAFGAYGAHGVGDGFACDEHAMPARQISMSDRHSAQAASNNQKRGGMDYPHIQWDGMDCTFIHA